MIVLEDHLPKELLQRIEPGDADRSRTDRLTMVEVLAELLWRYRDGQGNLTDEEAGECEAALAAMQWGVGYGWHADT